MISTYVIDQKFPEQTRKKMYRGGRSNTAVSFSWRLADSDGGQYAPSPPIRPAGHTAR
jgi:hypothetical protein